MFQLSLTTYGQSLVSSNIQIDGIALTASYTSTISSLENVSSLTTVFDDDSVGNYNGSTLNIRIRDLSSSAYQAKTIVFYKLVNGIKKIVAAYSNNSAIVNKTASSEVNLFLSFDASCFTHGFTLSSIQASPASASLNNDGIVHIEDESTSADDSYSVYSKPQVDALLENKQDSLSAGDGIAITNDVVRTTGIPFGICDNTSTATAFTVTVPGIYKLEDGVCCLVKNGVVTSAAGFTLDVNGLGAKPIYSNMAAATAESTIFNINYTLLFVYDSTRVSGGCWICYRGYYSDKNDSPLGYNLRTNNTVLTVTDRSRYYKIFFTSADNTQWVPASSNWSNDTTTSRTPNQHKINPFGRIVYTSASTSYTAGTNLAATTIWDQYPVNLGYSYGPIVSLTPKLPVFVKCAPQSDGSAIVDSTTPLVQTLPTTNDGKIYIFLGVAYGSETTTKTIDLFKDHPVYYHDGTSIKVWIGKDSYSKTETDILLTSYVPTSRKVNNKTLTSDITLSLDDVADGSTRKLSDYVPTTRTVNSKALSSNITLTASDVGALPSSTTIPTVNNATLTIQRNGTNVNTFTANASTDVTANIEVPVLGVQRNGADLTPDSSTKKVNVEVPVLGVQVNGSDLTPNSTTKKVNIQIKTVNSKNITGSGNVDLTASDVGALPSSTTIPTVNNSTITIKKNSDDTGDSFTTNASSGKTINLSLATVATSGSYSDLSNKPTIPTVNNASLTINKGGTNDTTSKTFTANASSNVTINLGLGAAADKAVDSTIPVSSASSNLPTSDAVVSYISGLGYITSSSSITGNAATSTKSKKLYFTSVDSGDVDLIEANSATKIIPSGTTKTKYLGDSDHQFKNIYSETFTGDLDGNASTATTATNLASAPSLSWTDASSSSEGATLKVTAGGQESTVTTISTVRKAYQPYISTSSTSSSYPLVFTSNVTAGFKALYTDTVNSCYYNPSTNTLACTNFSGTLSGNATGLSAVYSNSTKTLSLTNGNWVSNTRIEATSLSSYTLYVGGTTILHDSEDDTFSIMNNDGPIYFTDINGDNQLVIGTGSSFVNKLTFSSDMSDHSNSEVSSISLVTLVNDEDQEYTVTKWESSDSIRIESSSSVALVGDSSSLRVSDQIYINNNIIPISTVNIGDDIGNPINNIYTQYLDLCYTNSDDSPSNYYFYANSNGTYLSSSFLPDSSSSLNLGSTSKKWYNTYSDIVRTDNIRPIDNDTPNPANLSGYTKILYGALEGKDSSNNEFYFFPVNNRSTPAFGCGGNILPSTTSTGLSNGLYLGSSNAKWNTVYSRYLGRYESANAESRIAAFYGNSLYAQNFNIPFGTCSTGSSTQIKEVNLTNNSGMPVSELFTGMIILVRFNETNTKSDPALRITGVGTGYKFIKRVGTTAAGTDEASSWMANETVMLRYDGTNWVIVNHNTTAMSNIDSSITNIIPSANNSYNIGSNAYYWKEIHAVKLYLYSGTNRSYMNYYSSGIDVYGNLTPGNSGYNLGSVSYPWKNIYGVLTSLYSTGIGSIHLALAIFKNTSSTYNYFIRKGTTISLNTSLNAQTTLGGDTQTATLVSVTGLYAARFALSSDYTGFTSNTSNDLRIVPVQSDASTTTAITSTTPLAIDGSTFALLNEVFVPKNKSNGVIIPVLLLRLT